MQMKKILGTTALAVAVAASLNAASFKPGAYAGFNVGYASLNPKGKVREVAAAPTVNGLIKKTKGGMQANILVGYESMPTEGLILGGEWTFGSMFGTSKSSITASGALAVPGDVRGYKINQKWKTGLHALVGTPVSDTVSIYGKLGLLYSQFDLKATNIPNYADSTSPNFSKKSSVWGLEPGVRVSVALTDTLSAQFDANYAIYQKTKKTNVLPGTPDTGGHVTNVTYQPHIWGVTAGISYKL